MPRLLALAPDAFTVLVGPGTPLCPGLLGHGIDALSGLVVTDPDGAARATAEGGAMNALKPHTRFATLTR